MMRRINMVESKAQHLMPWFMQASTIRDFINEAEIYGITIDGVNFNYFQGHRYYVAKVYISLVKNSIEKVREFLRMSEAYSQLIRNYEVFSDLEMAVEQGDNVVTLTIKQA